MNLFVNNISYNDIDYGNTVYNDFPDSGVDWILGKVLNPMQT